MNLSLFDIATDQHTMFVSNDYSDLEQTIKDSALEGALLRIQGCRDIKVSLRLGEMSFYNGEIEPRNGAIKIEYDYSLVRENFTSRDSDFFEVFKDVELKIRMALEKRWPELEVSLCHSYGAYRSGNRCIFNWTICVRNSQVNI